MKTLITGSTKGIGKQIGIDLLDRGEFVIFVAHSKESILILDDELSAYENYIIKECDLSNFENFGDLIEFVYNFTPIDNIICNVGITDRTKFGNIKMKNWNNVINTNLTNPFFMIQALKDNIKKKGKILFVGSISGHIPDVTSISYGVSKGALEILTKYLAKEFAYNQITVNVIAPGYTITEWHKNKPQDQLERIANKTLLKRFATSKEISNACLSILDNDYINGQTISVDGGFGLGI